MAYSPFKMKGSPMQRNFGIGASPTKKMKGTEGKGEEKGYPYMEDPKRERTDKHGRTQKEVLEMREKKEGDWIDKVNTWAKQNPGQYDEEKEAKARKKLNKLKGETQYSADSIAGVNKELARQAELAMKKKKKKADESFDAL
tara:strand:- start:186 stop:611 length:426 start_codon:yes stop_codon:yes gene_type:complete